MINGEFSGVINGSFWITVADLSSDFVVVAMILGVAAWLLFCHKSKLPDFLISLAVSGFGSEVIKDIVNSPRPVSEHIYEGSGFPSTHTTLAFMAFFFVLNVCHRFSLFRSKDAFFVSVRAKLFLFILAGFAIMVGLLRILAQAHFLIDVLGGVVLAYLVSILFMYYDVSVRRIK